MNINAHKFVILNRVIFMMRDLGLNNEPLKLVVDATQTVFNDDPCVQKSFDFARYDKKDHDPQEISYVTESEWQQKFQNQEMFKSVPNYINSIKNDIPKLAQYCQVKALNYLKNYSVVAKLVEAHKRKEAEKMKDDASGNNVSEDEEDEILAHYLEVMKKMEKYLDMMMKAKCVPVFLKSVNDAEVTDALNRLPNVKSIIQKTKGISKKHVLNFNSKLSDFERNTGLLIRRSYSNPFYKGNITNNVERRKDEVKPIIKELNKMGDKQQEITEETPTESRLSLYSQELAMLEFFYTKLCMTKYLEINFDSQRELQTLSIQILDAEYDWMEQFQAKNKIDNTSNFSLPHIIDFEKMGVPKQVFTAMTEAAINIVTTAVEHVNKTQPGRKILPISNERLELARSKGIWSGWHEKHFERIGLTKYTMQMARDLLDEIEQREQNEMRTLQKKPRSRLQDDRQSQQVFFEKHIEDLRKILKEGRVYFKPQPVQSTKWRLLLPQRHGHSSELGERLPPPEQQPTPPCPESSSTSPVNPTSQQQTEPESLPDESERLDIEAIQEILRKGFDHYFKPQSVRATTERSISSNRAVSPSTNLEPSLKQQLTPPCPKTSNRNSVNSTDAGKVGENQTVVLELNVIETNELPALAHLEQSTGKVVLQPLVGNPSEEQQVAEHGLEEPNVQQQEPQTQPVVVEYMEVGDGENVVNDLHAFENELPRQQIEAPNHPIAVQNGEVGDVEHLVSDPHVIEAKEPATKYDKKEVKEILAKKKKHSRLSLPIRILHSVPKLRLISKKYKDAIKKKEKRNKSTSVALEPSAKQSDTAGNSGDEKDKHVVEKNEETNPEKTHSDAHHTNQMTTQNSTLPDQLALSFPLPHISSKLPICLEFSNSDHAQPAVAVHTELNVEQTSNTVALSTEAGKAISLQKVLHSQPTEPNTQEPDEPPDQEAAICVDANGKNQNVALKPSASEASDPTVSAHLTQPTQTAVLQPLEVEDVHEPQQDVQGELEMASEQHAGPANQPVAGQNERVGDVKNVVPDPHAIKANGSATNIKYDKKEVEEILAKKKKHSRLSLPIRIIHSVPKMRLVSKTYKDAIKKREKRKKSTIVALEPSGTPNDTTGYSEDEKDEHVVEKNEETNPEKTKSAHSNRMTTQNSTLPNNVHWFSVASELLNVVEQSGPISHPFPRARSIQKVRISANTNRPTVHRMSRGPIPAESTSLGSSNNPGQSAGPDLQNE